MSFRSLLFCPDEKTALMVRQVLNELDFTVENVSESFAAVQRLTAEHFHALVVDCQNEQDASLLFKAARNSAQNSGSLSVAVVEGQAGVAKAFRIGANLVLTKPINVEQSKSTLRVARGLLKKTQVAAPAAPVSASTTAGAHTPAPVAPRPTVEPAIPAKAAAAASSLFTPAAKAPTLAPAPVASVPFSGLVLESEPEPITEASDAALLESLPQIGGKREVESPAPMLLSHAQPIAASTSGQGAAAARAPEAKPVEFRTAGAAPMVTNEPIVATGGLSSEPEIIQAEPISAPSFSSLESSGKSGSSGLLRVAVVLAVVAGGGYFAWKQPVVRHYADKLLHRTEAVAPATPAMSPEGEAQTPVAQTPIHEAPSTSETPKASHTVAPAETIIVSDSNTEAQAGQNHARPAASDSIEVQEMPLARDSAKVTLAPKPEPIVVKSGPAAEKPVAQAAAPPSLDAVAAKSEAAFPNLAPESFALPKAAPGTVRISQGVSQGLLVKKVQPVYPSFARQLHRDGTVQLLATIDKNGSVKKTQVLSGDVILARAATDAVKQWQYRPYLLNGQPVEIETQISVVFKSQ